MSYKTTSKRVASIAGKTLPKSNSPIEKTLAGSALSQAKPRVIGVNSSTKPRVIGVNSRRLGLEILNKSKKSNKKWNKN
jgi:hypothetical protein